MLNDEDLKTSERLLKEIRNRIDYLLNVGLSYLSLSRKSNTLSGGEFQRLNLANSLARSFEVTRLCSNNLASLSITNFEFFIYFYNNLF